MPGSRWRTPKVRRDRNDAERFVKVLNEQMPTDIEYHLLGSWRRGAPTIGDLDVLVVTESGELTENLFDAGVTLPANFVAQRHGAKVAQGDLVLPDGDGFHVDFWSCRPRERGAYLMFATGPMALNVAQRQQAVRMSMALSQVGLLARETKEQLDDGTERDIYRLIRWPWLEPEERQKWADVRTRIPS